jgi:hypothetical protein
MACNVQRGTVKAMIAALTCNLIFLSGAKMDQAIAQANPATSLWHIAAGPQTPDGAKTGGGTICTQEAAICPDGSSVVRTGPDCKLAPCPAKGDPGEIRQGAKRKPFTPNDAPKWIRSAYMAIWLIIGTLPSGKSLPCVKHVFPQPPPEQHYPSFCVRRLEARFVSLISMVGHLVSAAFYKMLST